jgi:hypothetical protein
MSDVYVRNPKKSAYELVGVERLDVAKLLAEFL